MVSRRWRWSIFWSVTVLAAAAMVVARLAGAPEWLRLLFMLAAAPGALLVVAVLVAGLVGEPER